MLDLDEDGVLRPASEQPVRAEATSLDGRTFDYGGPADSPWIPGDLVALRSEAGSIVCGQVLSKHQQTRGLATGIGSVLGTVDADAGIRLGPTGPFTQASIEAAPPALLRDLQAHSQADMRIGTVGAVDAMLRSKGFNRHTFMCGQSGSGKSYALGLLIEQLLIDTDVPLVILDPNADFVSLPKTLESAEGRDRARLDEASMRIFRPRSGGPEHDQLFVRFTELSFEAKAAILQLDPLTDRAEYNVLLHLEERVAGTETELLVRDLLAGDDDERAIGQRIENLGLLGWDIWATGRSSVLDDLRPFDRATVLDLSGFESPRERLVASLAVLNDLWDHREDRQPVILVIDEAHNVCTNAPTDPLEAATAARLVQIASEGRKYGIWLFLCTQRPSRIHEGVLSQCDNLIVMRMNSRGDLAQLEHTFGFAPAEMLAAAPYFRQGECLMAGGIIPAPTFVQVGRRRTREGGSDVGVSLPAP